MVVSVLGKKKKPHTSLSHPGQEAQGKQTPYLSCSSSSSLVQHSAWHTVVTQEICARASLGRLDFSAGRGSWVGFLCLTRFPRLLLSRARAAAHSRAPRSPQVPQDCEGLSVSLAGKIVGGCIVKRFGF